MITAIKILVMLAIFLLLAYPLLPLPLKLRKFSTAYALRYNHPDNRKNIGFTFVAVLVTVVVAILLGLVNWLVDYLLAIPFVGNLFKIAANLVSSQVNFIVFAVKMVLVNLIILYAFVILKAITKYLILNPIFGFSNRKKKEKTKKENVKGSAKDTDDDDEEEEPEEKTPEQIEEEREAERKRRRLRVPDFSHTSEEEEGEEEQKTESVEETGGAPEAEKKPRKERGAFSKWLLGFFFEGDDFEFALPWVTRLRTVLQIFVYFLEVVYGLLILAVLASVLFPLPGWMYTILTDVLQIHLWYVYPAASIVFLQEVCNVFKAPTREESNAITPEKAAEIEAESREARLRALQAELKRRFDSEHVLRYYPERVPSDILEYQCTNLPYASSLAYIRKRMELLSGKVVQSYMKCLDAIFNDDNVYFAASLYSEFGEYLVSYAYIRLLSGSRVIFVVSDPEERASLKKFVSERLRKMTGSSEGSSWRVYMSDERLDQADVFIASPEDFRDDNIVEQYPGFFEEVCNAIFIDADRIVELNSYLCPVMASRLQKATGRRISFVFLTLDLIKGFAAATLPRFFCVDKVLSFSSAEENEAVSYTLWNRESKNNRIYNKSGQKATALECIIAEQACRYGVDGVRVITESALDHAEKKILAMHNVEINKLHRGVADINYMIYSDERCNLSAALYACTRFRGRKKSVVHVISKPYLLREFFMAKANTEDYVNRSSFIQPRVTERADNHKLALLRIFCDATTERGLPITEFETRMRRAILDARERGDILKSARCRNILEKANVEDIKISELAAYLIAGLYDDDIDSFRAKDYYLIVESAKQDGYSLAREKHIVFNRVRDIFERLFAINRKVELRLNGDVIGELDTFPTRVHLEYIAGQSIVYNNAEYEIEHISEDGRSIYLRRENINFKNCLDTILLRRYQVESLTPIRGAGVLHSSRASLGEITVTPYKAKFVGETYGFYSLMVDRQTLDFYRGVEGNPHVRDPHVRRFEESPILHVSLDTRMECTDGMRLLMAAVFNEFVRTMFPHSYHCIAIVPVLAEPLPFSEEVEPESEVDQIRALYPYLKNPTGEFIETNPNRMQFMFINDCVDDVGILDWFYDPSARYMQEFLANIYSYLYWLSRRPEKAHYIYFGGKAIPECYDLEGCCELLKDYNFLLSDEGKKDYETAGDDEEDQETRRCSFCHRVMESGRFSFFDKTRFICADCFDTVDTADKLEEIYDKVRDYMAAAYPDIKIGAARVKVDKVYEVDAVPVLSEHCYRIDISDRAIFVERDTPVNNAAVSILRGLITLWQNDNDLIISYATAQLYYEELLYLRSIGENESADWISENLDADVKAKMGEIVAYVNGGSQSEQSISPEAAEEPETVEPSEETESTDEEITGDEIGEVDAESNTDNAEGDDSDEDQDDDLANDEEGLARTSFLFMRLKAKEIDTVSEEEPDEGEEYSDVLYDPNRIPRFWKRYLRGETIDDGKETDLPDPIGDGVSEDDTDADEDDTSEDQVVDAEKNTDNALWGLFGKKKKEEQPAPEAPIVTPENPATVSDEPTIDPEISAVEETLEPIMEEIPEKDVPVPSETPTQLSKEERKKAEKERKEEEKRRKKEEEQKEKERKEEEKRRKKEEKRKAKERRKAEKRRGKTEGDRIVPYEEEEDTNPRIRVYNEIVRHAFNYSEEMFSREGVTDDDLALIFRYVRFDYPELFWLGGYVYTLTEIGHKFRCRDANDRLDVKKIKKDRKALHKAAQPFLKGIKAKTDPYLAALTIYRRVILAFDYDGVGLAAGVDKDPSKEDRLRSLRSALVDHKVVCAGYAVAMQYLLQSVGIVCGYVSSRPDATEGTHAFNVLKIGKYCYYMDATWGDTSNTEKGDAGQDEVFYDYFCVPFDEFTRTEKNERALHYPRDEYYPGFKPFTYTNHEYYRYHNAYLRRYDEEELIRIFADAALRYDPKNMGRFMVSFRCYNGDLLKYIVTTLNNNGKIHKIVKAAKERAAETKKSAAKHLDNRCKGHYANYNTGVAYFYFDNPSEKKKKRK